MLANNNHGIITKMAMRTLKGNRRKFGSILAAVMLSAFMLLSILTVGTAYFKMQHTQDIRLKGAEYDAVLINGFTSQQKKQCEENSDIASAGTSSYAGYAEKTDADDTLHTGLLWCDATYWEEQMEPARESVKGHYPQGEDELMVTKESLQDCGKEHLGIGDTFTLTYSDKNGSHTKEFEISGIWEGYGEKEAFYVSKEFYEQTGYELSDNGILHLKFKNPVVLQKTLLELEENLNLDKRQHFFVTAEMEKSVGIFAGMAGLAGIVCFSAYLLIYNILNMSVSGNIRYYGLLQTVGMTPKQVYKLLKKQMLLVGSIGTGGGILSGMAASFLLLPYIVKSLGIMDANIEISFHPLIFFLTILLIGITICLGSRKPAKIATSVSPMEALGQRSFFSNKKNHRIGGFTFRGKGNLLWRMAMEQLTKDKKKTGVVILSLATVLSVFLCFITIILSQGTRTIMANYMDTDLIIWNDTLLKEDEEEWAQIMDEDFLDEIRSNKAVKEVHPLLSAKIIVPWEPEFADIWMREYYEIWMDRPYEEDIEEYKQHPENFYSYMKGIDETEFNYLNSSLEGVVDKETFLKGEACIIYSFGLYPDMKEQEDMSVKYSLYEEEDSSYEMKIAAITYDGNYGAMVGMAPVILVSDSFMKQTVKNPYILKLNVRYEKEYDENAEAKMKKIIEQSPYAKDFSYESRIENMEEVKEAQGNMMGVGIGTALLLFLIGILNYINTVSGNIRNRKVVLAILESVGMTRKQIKQMLIREGLLFAGGSLLITATVGLGITYVCYQSMNYMGIAFQIPIIPMIAVIISVVVICVTIPLISYRIMEGKKTIVEKIREFE